MRVRHPLFHYSHWSGELLKWRQPKKDIPCFCPILRLGEKGSFCSARISAAPSVKPGVFIRAMPVDGNWNCMMLAKLLTRGSTDPAKRHAHNPDGEAWFRIHYPLGPVNSRPEGLDKRQTIRRGASRHPLHSHQQLVAASRSCCSALLLYPGSHDPHDGLVFSGWDHRTDSAVD